MNLKYFLLILSFYLLQIGNSQEQKQDLEVIEKSIARIWNEEMLNAIKMTSQDLQFTQEIYSIFPWQCMKFGQFLSQRQK